MKKFLIFVLAAMFMFASCNQNKKSEHIQDFSGYQFEQVVQEDYDRMQASPTDYVFFEAEAEFAEPLNLNRLIKIDKITTIFQSQDSVIIYEHNKGNTIRTAYCDIWSGDIECNPYGAVSLNTVIYMLQDEEIVPQTRFCIFRRPVVPPFDSCACYIFGQSQVVVNACTGKIIE